MLREFKTLVPYFKRHALWYLGGVFFLFITNASQLIVPQFLQRGIDIISSGNFQLSEIVPFALMIAGAACSTTIGRFGWRLLILGVSRRIEYDLRARLFRHLQRLSSSFFGRQKTGDLMARFTNDLRAVRDCSGCFLRDVGGYARERPEKRRRDDCADR